MHHPALRSVLGRASRAVLPGATPSSRQSSAAWFSSTPTHAVLKNVPPRRARMAAAASELGALSGSNNNNNKKEAPRTSPFQKTASTDLVDARAASAGGSGGKIINVRSLPRRSPGGGAGSSQFPGTGVTSATASARFRRSPGDGEGASPFQRTAGPPGNRVGRLPQKGRASKNNKSGKRGSGSGSGRKRDGEAGGGEGGGGRRRAGDEVDFTPAETAWLETREVGTAAAFAPAGETLESLAAYGPAVASGAAAATALGPTAAALRAMRVLGGATPYCDDIASPVAARARLVAGETVFFDSPVERAGAAASLLSRRAAERLRAADGDTEKPITGERLLAPASAATKAAIVDAAVRGLYESPGSAASDAESAEAVWATLQRYRAKDYTYSAEARQQFDDKVRSLLAGKPAKRPAARA